MIWIIGTLPSQVGGMPQLSKGPTPPLMGDSGVTRNMVNRPAPYPVRDQRTSRPLRILGHGLRADHLDPPPRRLGKIAVTRNAPPPVTTAIRSG